MISVDKNWPPGDFFKACGLLNPALRKTSLISEFSPLRYLFVEYCNAVRFVLNPTGAGNYSNFWIRAFAFSVALKSVPIWLIFLFKSPID